MYRPMLIDSKKLQCMLDSLGCSQAEISSTICGDSTYLAIILRRGSISLEAALMLQYYYGLDYKEYAPPLRGKVQKEMAQAIRVLGPDLAKYYLEGI